MKKIILSFVTIISFFSCSSNPNEVEKANLEGNWISKDYQEHIETNHSPKQVLMDIAFYTTELVVDTKRFKDSLVVYNGQKERANLPFKRVGDTLKLKINGEVITNLVYSKADNSLSFVDQKLNRVFRFVRADSLDLDKSYEMPIAFPTIVNKATIVGKFDLYENNAKQQIVEFTKFGGIKGWEKYGTFSVGVNDDAMSVFEGDLITCFGAKESNFFAFDATKKDTITFHNVSMDNKTKQIYKENVQVLLVRRK